MSLLEKLGGLPSEVQPTASKTAETLDVSTASEDEMLARAEKIVVDKDIGYTAPSVDEETIQEVAANAQDVHNLAKDDLDFLAALCMPLVFEFGFPPVFQGVWHWLLGFVHQVRIFPQLALGLPRGFGKTTLIKIFVIYCLLFTKKKFILIIASTGPLAQNILADVMDMLNEPNIKATFGDWSVGVEKETQELKKFGFRGRNIILAAIGAEGSLRGLNLKNERPDVMIFEDIQTREQADSETQSKHLEDWMVGTAMKAKSPKGCMFLFVANMYPTDHSILRKLKKNPMWTKFIAGGILEDGTSLWEDLQPITQLLAEFENDFSMGKAEIFFSEVLNDENAAVNNLVDLSALRDPPMEDGDIAAGKFIVIDPATDKINSDEVSIGYFEVHDARPVLMHIIEGRISPSDCIRKTIKLGLEKNCRCIIVESNAYQYSLLHWFGVITESLQITGFYFEPIYSGVRSKNVRILDMFKSLTSHDIFLHQSVRAAVYPQITGFNALRRDNTDGLLDLLTYAIRIVAEFSGLIISLTEMEQQEFETLEVDEFNTEF